MVKFFPQGAIQTRDQLASHIEKDAYTVYGLGSSSYMEKVSILGPITDHGLLGRSSAFVWVRKTNEYAKNGYVTNEDSLNDRNIEGGGYNGHYMFINEKDALAYLEHAKKATKDIDYSDIFDSY